MRKFSYLILILLMMDSAVYAQIMFGLCNSNYAGLGGIKINPSSMSDSRLRWDANVISLSAFAQNNFLSIPAGSLNFSSLTSGDTSGVNLHFGSNVADVYAFADVFTKLPSLMLNLPKLPKHSFAFSTNFRAMASGQVPFYIMKFISPGADYNTSADYVGDVIRLGTLGWMEFSGSYSTVLKDRGQDFFAAGATLSWLRAVMGMYMANRQVGTVPAAYDSTVYYNVNGEYGRAFAVFAGGGIGADLGATYERRKKNAGWISIYKSKPLRTYEYRIGASLLDILGSVNLHNNAMQMIVGAGDTPIIDSIIPIARKNAGTVDSLLNTKFFHYSAGDSSDNFKMRIPPAFSLQCDYNFYKDRVYLNLAIVQRLTGKSSALLRPNFISFTPRFESKWIEVAMPVTYYDYTRVMIGAAIRIHSFYIGTDQIGPLIGASDLNGISLYFGLKISAFKERKGLKDEGAYSKSLIKVIRPFQKK